MIIVCIAIVLIIMYFCCMKCRHTHTIFKYCFPFLPISRIVRTSRRTDLFVEVTNVTKGNGIWAHFVSTGCFLCKVLLLAIRWSWLFFCWYFFCLYLTFGECCESVPQDRTGSYVSIRVKHITTILGVCTS